MKKNICKICNAHTSDCKCKLPCNMYPDGSAVCPRHGGIMANYSQPCICAKDEVTDNWHCKFILAIAGYENRFEQDFLMTQQFLHKQNMQV
jgi:hypothetical protein